MAPNIQLNTTVHHLLRNLQTEAMSLSLRAQAYFGLQDESRPDIGDPVATLTCKRDMLIITARLSQVLLWVLEHNTAAAEAVREPVDSHRWQADEFLLYGGENEITGLAPEFESLRQDSLALYRRVVRIESETLLH